MSAKLTVKVRRDGRQVVAPLQDRPVRLMPDGYAGVVYGGDVYPVRAGDYIDLGDPSVPKHECESFLDVGQPIPYFSEATQAAADSDLLVVTKWNVESNQFGHYVIFDGDETTARAVANLMRTVGLGVRRWDVSSRVAADGYFYDWFVRLEFRGSREECLERVHEALTGNVQPVHFNDDTSTESPSHDLEYLSPETLEQFKAVGGLDGLIDNWLEAIAAKDLAESLLVEVETAKEVLEAARAHLEDLLDAERSQTRLLRTKLRRAEKHAADAQSEADRIRGLFEAAPASDSGDLAVVAELQEQLARADRERVALEREWIESEEERERLATRCEESDVHLVQLEAEITALQERAERAEAQMLAPSRRALDQLSSATHVAKRDRSYELARCLRSGWPRLVLHEDGLDEMKGFTNLAEVFKTLHQLNGGSTLPFKVWQGRKGVRELDMKLTTGRDNMGRIYYRRLEDDRLWVWLHRKRDGKEQGRFVERIAAADPTSVDVDF